MTSPSPLTIIAVHGNGGGGFRFSRLLPFVPDHINLVTPTLPGFAAVPKDPRLQTIADYAAHIHTLVMETSAPRVLLGHGIGGSLVLEFIQHYADDVDGIILHAPVGASLDSRRFPKLMKLPGMAELGKQVFASPLFRPLWTRLLFQADVPKDYLNQFFAEYRHCTAFAQMFDLITADWFNKLTPHDIPAVLLWGEREKVLKVEQLEAFLHLLPNASRVTVPDWDHFTMVDTPQAYMDIVQLASNLVHREA
ncbi:MAG: alpha/beta hydrolase [Deinococcota bacterium]